MQSGSSWASTNVAMLRRLSRSDIRAALDVLAGVQDAAGADAFATRVTDTFSRLIRSAVTCYTELDAGSNSVRVVSHRGDPVPPADRKRYQQHARQHPVIRYQRACRDPGAYAISDFLKRDEWRRSDLYQECFRPLHIEDQLGLALRAREGKFVAISFNREWRSFRARDRALLTLLQPHLEYQYASASAFEGMRAAVHQVLRGFDDCGAGIVIVDGKGRIRLATAHAQQILITYFGWRGAPLRLPEDLASWLEQSQSFGRNGDTPPLRLRPWTGAREDARLVVRHARAGAETMLIFEEQRVSRDPTALVALGLSQREAEVLKCMADGLTNKEIATALGVSASTVNTHLDHIYAKLGVQTRTGALVRALEVWHGTLMA